jgi:hypothetical protein
VENKLNDRYSPHFKEVLSFLPEKPGLKTIIDEYDIQNVLNIKEIVYELVINRCYSIKNGSLFVKKTLNTKKMIIDEKEWNEIHEIVWKYYPEHLVFKYKKPAYREFWIRLLIKDEGTRKKLTIERTENESKKKAVS